MVAAGADVLGKDAADELLERHRLGREPEREPAHGVERLVERDVAEAALGTARIIAGAPGGRSRATAASEAAQARGSGRDGAAQGAGRRDAVLEPRVHHVAAGRGRAHGDGSRPADRGEGGRVEGVRHGHAAEAQAPPQLARGDAPLERGRARRVERRVDGGADHDQRNATPDPGRRTAPCRRTAARGR